MNKEENILATKRIKNKKTYKISKKDIIKMLIPLIIAVIFIYVLYKIIKLIVVPTDIVMIENGTIFKEESATRICYKG